MGWLAVRWALQYRQPPDAMRQEREGEDIEPAVAGVRQRREAPASSTKCKGVLKTQSSR